MTSNPGSRNFSRYLNNQNKVILMYSIFIVSMGPTFTRIPAYPSFPSNLGFNSFPENCIILLITLNPPHILTLHITERVSGDKAKLHISLNSLLSNSKLMLILLSWLLVSLTRMSANELDWVSSLSTSIPRQETVDVHTICLQAKNIQEVISIRLSRLNRWCGKLWQSKKKNST